MGNRRRGQFILDQSVASEPNSWVCQSIEALCLARQSTERGLHAWPSMHRLSPSRNGAKGKPRSIFDRVIESSPGFLCLGIDWLEDTATRAPDTHRIDGGGGSRQRRRRSQHRAAAGGRRIDRSPRPLPASSIEERPWLCARPRPPRPPPATAAAVDTSGVGRPVVVEQVSLCGGDCFLCLCLSEPGLAASGPPGSFPSTERLSRVPATPTHTTGQVHAQA